MYGLGMYESNMSGINEIPDILLSKKLPEKYNLTKDTLDVVNQGNNGICVSVVLIDIINYSFKQSKKEKLNLNLDYFYHLREDKDLDGMTPREAFELAESNDLINVFAKINTLNTLQKSILTNGPCMMCLPVRSFNVDFWNGDNIIGGHAVSVMGWTKNSIILKNSWGKNFGDKGITYLPFSEFTNKNVLEMWTLLI